MIQADTGSLRGSFGRTQKDYKRQYSQGKIGESYKQADRNRGAHATHANGLERRAKYS